MNTCIETIKIDNGIVHFLKFHNERFNKTRQILFNTATKINLASYLQPPKIGIYRCRVIYADKIEKIEYIPYQTKNFQTFKIVETNEIDYSFKYLNRDAINKLVELKGLADDILIIKQNLITDTSIANVAFWLNNQWLTPLKPLLAGTTRRRLLQAKKITTANLSLNDIKFAEKMAIMNALIGFYVVEGNLRE